jgi:hypothetical protein
VLKEEKKKMDYAQEQSDEIEALESIYADVFEKLTDKPPWKVTSFSM